MSASRSRIGCDPVGRGQVCCQSCSAEFCYCTQAAHVARAPEQGLSTAAADLVTSNQQLTRKVLLAYATPALPLCLAGIPILTYLPAFYAKELHLSVGMVGLVFLIARLWDGSSDLLVGWLSDTSQSRWGRRKPWTLAGAPALMLATWFLCNPHRGAGLLYLGFWAALFYLAWTTVYIPYLSWGTELSNDYVERSRVTSFRESFTMVGVLFFAGAPLIFLPADTPLRDVLFLISTAVVCSIPLTVIPLAIAVPDRGEVPPPSRRHIVRDIVALARDRVLFRFEIGRLFWAIEEGVTNSLLVFSFGTGLGLSNRFFSALFILYAVTLTTLPLALRLAPRVEKHVLLAAGVGIQALTYAAALCLPQGCFIGVAVLWGIIGLANTAMLTLPNSIVADIVDHGEVITGERRSGAYVALDNLIYKVGMALGVGLAFGLLALVHFEPGASVHDAADVRNVRLLGFGLPCLLSIPTVVLYFTHPITRAVHSALRRQIERTVEVSN